MSISLMIDMFQIQSNNPFVSPPKSGAPLSSYELPDIVPAIEDTVYPQIGFVVPILISVAIGWRVLNSFSGGN